MSIYAMLTDDNETIYPIELCDKKVESFDYGDLELQHPPKLKTAKSKKFKFYECLAECESGYQYMITWSIRKESVNWLEPSMIAQYLDRSS